MKLLDYINTHKNWEKELLEPPYSLKISYDGPYILFKYQQFISDMSLQICQEARGAIFRRVDNHYIPVSIAMYKFFNATEEYSAIHDLDWKTAIISEKIDGSLMRLAYDKIDNNWLLSSNGTIYARNVEVANTNFEEIFISILGGQQEYTDLLKQLNKDYCYFFEMVSSYNRICVCYDEASIYYLGCRNMITLKEDDKILEYGKIKHPKIYKLYSLSDCITAADTFEKNFEGFVVKDAKWHRVKIKTPWYIAIHRLRGNSSLTITRVIEMWQSDSLDDFIAYYPEFKSFVDEVIKQVRHLIDIADIAFSTIMSHEPPTRADFAQYACSYIGLLKSFLFARLDKKVMNATEFYKEMRAKNLSAHLQTILTQKAVGIIEDN